MDKKKFAFTSEDIYYRSATEEDAKIIFSFINHESIRSNSYSSEKINWEEHQNWFNKTLASPNAVIIICLNENNEFLGQVRFNTSNIDNTITVSIFVNQNFHSKGLGTKLLKDLSQIALKAFKAEKIIAHIKSDNIGSIKAFKKAGYVFYQEKIIKEIESVELVYK
ncbi:MAG: hypothetical protein HeimC3_33390 [Candidatus Heimdallarchaeota archaeon LC_3]|nr:MAG: hypothetical protein HeimC3_33390 [Candidatus Heimdallarchaeota archaeon LC_3]